MIRRWCLLTKKNPNIFIILIAIIDDDNDSNKHAICLAQQSQCKCTWDVACLLCASQIKDNQRQSQMTDNMIDCDQKSDCNAIDSIKTQIHTHLL